MDGCAGGHTVPFIIFNKLGDCGRFIGKDKRPTSNVQRPMMNEKTNFEQLMLIEKKNSR
jgi:hypothetical protein